MVLHRKTTNADKANKPAKTDANKVNNLSTVIANADGVEDLGIVDINGDKNLCIGRQPGKQGTASDAACTLLFFLVKLFF